MQFLSFTHSHCALHLPSLSLGFLIYVTFLPSLPFSTPANINSLPLFLARFPMFPPSIGPYLTHSLLLFSHPLVCPHSLSLSTAYFSHGGEVGKGKGDHLWRQNMGEGWVKGRIRDNNIRGYSCGVIRTYTHLSTACCHHHLSITCCWKW